MERRQIPLIAAEGVPYLLLMVVLTGFALRYWSWPAAIVPAAVFVLLLLVFRDPQRQIPASPLGVVSPADGVVTEVGVTDRGVLDREAHKIVIRVAGLGTYTARCPIEGKVMDLDGESPASGVRGENAGLWVRTDEDDDVILQFSSHRLGFAPLAFVRYGERVGQGQRCAYLRLTRQAEIQLPIESRVLVKAGQRVTAGSDLLAKLPHP